MPGPRHGLASPPTTGPPRRAERSSPGRGDRRAPPRRCGDPPHRRPHRRRRGAPSRGRSTRTGDATARRTPPSGTHRTQSRAATLRRRRSECGRGVEPRPTRVLRARRAQPGIRRAPQHRRGTRRGLHATARAQHGARPSMLRTHTVRRGNVRRAGARTRGTACHRPGPWSHRTRPQDRGRTASRTPGRRATRREGPRWSASTTTRSGFR